MIWGAVTDIGLSALKEVLSFVFLSMLLPEFA